MISKEDLSKSGTDKKLSSYRMTYQSLTYNQSMDAPVKDQDNLMMNSMTLTQPSVDE